MEANVSQLTHALVVVGIALIRHGESKGHSHRSTVSAQHCGEVGGEGHLWVEGDAHLKAAIILF